MREVFLVMPIFHIIAKKLTLTILKIKVAMKIEVAKSNFAVHYVDTDNSLIEQHWTNVKKKMSIAEYQDEMFNYLKFTSQYKTKNALINALDFGFLITPEVQRWVDENIAQKANEIVENIAFVLPDDFFANVSIQQTMGEHEGMKYQNIRYFKTLESAKEWLLQ